MYARVSSEAVPLLQQTRPNVIDGDVALYRQNLRYIKLGLVLVFCGSVTFYDNFVLPTNRDSSSNLRGWRNPLTLIIYPLEKLWTP